MSHYPCERQHMTCEASTLTLRRWVREAAEPAAPGESVKAAINRAARRLGLGYARARDHWYGRARSVPADEFRAVEARLPEILRERAARLEHDLAATRARLEGRA